jgi:hypothetical protein
MADGVDRHVVGAVEQRVIATGSEGPGKTSALFTTIMRLTAAKQLNRFAALSPALPPVLASRGVVESWQAARAITVVGMVVITHHTVPVPAASWP